MKMGFRVHLKIIYYLMNKKKGGTVQWLGQPMSSSSCSCRGARSPDSVQLGLSLPGATCLYNALQETRVRVWAAKRWSRKRKRKLLNINNFFERKCASSGGGAERGIKNLKQTPCSAWNLTRGSIS